MSTKTKIKKSTKNRYDLGSFVTQNQEVANQYNSQISSLGTPQGGGAGQGALSGAGTGASIGTAILPGWGTAIGAVVGAAGGLIFGSAKDRRERKLHNEQVGQLNQARSNVTQDLYESSIDTNNQNPYGIYEDGGDVLSNNDPTINIEKGEIQIDPTSGKILRKFKGINPETGGLYENHSKKGDDTINNMVTAKEGDFIITKKEANKYEKAVENNDKLYQNSIMSNIRNKKAKENTSKKYAIGGDILDPSLVLPLQQSMGVNLNSNINVPSTLNRSPNIGNTSANISRTGQGLNYGNIASTAMNYLPSLYNMVQGSRKANTMPYTPIRLDVENRQKILSNLPSNVSANPALNNIRGARRRAYGSINANTSNPSIARANKLALEGQFLGAENEAEYNTQLMNNQIGTQRAQILSGLSAQDQNRDSQNVQMLNNTFLQNRQMQQAKQQQFDYGLSQAQQMYQNNRTNQQRGNMDQKTLELLQQIFPNAGSLFDSWKGGNR